MNLAQKAIVILKSGGGGQTPDEAYADIVLGYSPTIYYKLNEASGTTAINYGSLSSADGTYSASDIAGQTTGPFGGLAPLFVSTTKDLVNIYSSALSGDFDLTDATIFYWFRCDASYAESHSDRFLQLLADASNYLATYRSGTGFRVELRGTGNTTLVVLTTTSFEDAGWHLMLITNDVTGGTLTIYVDNVSVGTGVARPWGASSLASTDAVLAANDSVTPAAANSVDGSMAHFGYCSTLLDGTARTALYNGGPV